MADPATVELHLRRDLRELEEEPFADEAFCAELYRALASTHWRQADLDGAVAFSWKRAEDLVNEIRAEKGLERLELARSGGEGDVSARIDRVLAAEGWTHRPVDTSSHDPTHVGEGEPSPPPDTGG